VVGVLWVVVLGVVVDVVGCVGVGGGGVVVGGVGGDVARLGSFMGC
jgi:hypothetical protein